jgi:uncharacterized membrane protein
MKPLIVLLTSFLVTLIILYWFQKHWDFKKSARIAMACMLIFTAIGHFIFTKGMANMFPEFIPFKIELVIWSGVLEILLAIGLLIPTLALKTSWMVILFLILVLPLNIYSAAHNIHYQTGLSNGPGLPYLFFRIPVQIFYIGWMYFATMKP